MTNLRRYQFNSFPTWEFFLDCYRSIEHKVSAHVIHGDGTEDFWDADGLADLYAGLWGEMKAERNFTLAVESVLPDPDPSFDSWEGEAQR